MFDSDPIEFAIRGERGIDIFVRLDDASQKRARFRCIATITGTPETFDVADFEPHEGRDEKRLIALGNKFLGDQILAHPFALGDIATWPSVADADNPVAVFLHLEFFRAWQVADMASRRLLTALAQGSASLPMAQGQLAGAIAPVLDFNQVSRGVALTRLLAPMLQAMMTNPQYRDDPAGSTGFALRMLGDLCLRADEFAQALTCFELAVVAGDNPHRRRKVIEAAMAAGNHARADQHLKAYSARWHLPDDLAKLASGGRT